MGALLSLTGERAGYLWRRLPEAEFPVQAWPSASSRPAPPGALTPEQDMAAALAAAGAAAGPASDAQGAGEPDIGKL